jgi:hypothetical protein
VKQPHEHASDNEIEDFLKEISLMKVFVVFRQQKNIELFSSASATIHTYYPS